ncbi:MAG: hypothetical protein IPI46_01615 [Bacteroidetes bacterium]|nr:hypothetical protein [Bacteroidota bacterium]
MQKFTSNDLLQYLFNESDAVTQNEIKVALQCDFQLHEEYLELQQSLKGLSNYRLEPNDKVMQHILEELGCENEIHMV